MARTAHCGKSLFGQGTVLVGRAAKHTSKHLVNSKPRTIIFNMVWGKLSYSVGARMLLSSSSSRTEYDGQGEDGALLRTDVSSSQMSFGSGYDARGKEGDQEPQWRDVHGHAVVPQGMTTNA